MQSSTTLRTLLKAQDIWDEHAQPARKRQRSATTTPNPTQDQAKSKPLSQEELLRRHVENVLAVDRCMKGHGTASNNSVSSKYQRQRRAAQALLHSSTSRRGTAAVPEPTFSKQKYAQQQKENSLQKIAKLLKKTASNTKKRTFG